jgi:hypothetical protein
MVHHLWDLVRWNAEQIREDFRTWPQDASADHTRTPLTVVGPADRLWIDPSARIENRTLADTTRGPVIVDREAVVTEFSRLEGPCFVGPGTHVVSAKIRGGSSLGPDCQVAGEIDASILQGDAIQRHHGYMGHSYLGAWIDLGAGTRNRPVRNDYGEITVMLAGNPVPTGLSKIGCFVGDYTRTGPGVRLHPGVQAGVFCNLLPGGQLPGSVPSFCNALNGELTLTGNLPALLQTAAQRTERCGALFTDAHAALFRDLFHRTASDRQHAFEGAPSRSLRQSA